MKRGPISVCSITAAAIALATPAPAAAAIINKQLQDKKRGTFATPVEMATAIFGTKSASGGGTVAVALQVITGFVLLMTLVALLAGVWRMVRGDRGGGELVGGAIFGLAALTAAVAVVM